MATRIYLVLCLLSALLPLLPIEAGTRHDLSTFPGWPEFIAGNKMTQLPLSKRERHFVKDFPGKIARFSDGQREVILRWVNAPSRKLHPASDCFKGIGYTIKPLAIVKDKHNNAWGHFEASMGNSRIRVRERIYDHNGNQWTDVSAWYWASLFGKQQGPWWAITIAETMRD